MLEQKISAVFDSRTTYTSTVVVKRGGAILGHMMQWTKKRQKMIEKEPKKHLRII